MTPPPILPIDLSALAGIVLGTLIFLIPIAGLTLRFALKPLVEAWLKNRDSQAPQREIEAMQRRMLEIEQELLELKAVGRQGALPAPEDSSLRLRR